MAILVVMLLVITAWLGFRHLISAIVGVSQIGEISPTQRSYHLISLSILWGSCYFVFKYDIWWASLIGIIAEIIFRSTIFLPEQYITPEQDIKNDISEIIKINRDKWEDLADYISHHFSLISQEWFSTVVQDIHSSAKNIIPTNLSGPILFELKAFQLYIIKTIIINRHYMTESMFFEFFYLMQDSLMGDDINSCETHFKQYRNIEDFNEAYNHFIRQATLIMIGIDEDKNPKLYLNTNGCINMYSILLANKLMIIVGTAFGDDSIKESYENIRS